MEDISERENKEIDSANIEQKPDSTNEMSEEERKFKFAKHVLLEFLKCAIMCAVVYLCIVYNDIAGIVLVITIIVAFVAIFLYSLFIVLRHNFKEYNCKKENEK